MQLKNHFAGMGFHLREKVFGRVALRRHLPLPRHDDARGGEIRFYNQLLSRALPEKLRAEISLVWDIGCRNWSYAPALASAFSNAALIGVEVDGGRRYTNLHRRRDQANAHAAELVFDGHPARCIFADFRDVEIESHMPAWEAGLFQTAFCFFFPFVSSNPCLRWGLPLKFASFDTLLRHAHEGALRAGSAPMFVSAHQGEWEAELARAAFATAGIPVQETIVAAREFMGLWPSAHDVHVLSNRS